MGFSVNSVTISGNLTRDPELRALNSGTTVCSLRIAHNSRRKNGSTGEWEDQAHFFDVTVWSGQGEWIANNMHKGQQIVVQGTLRWREWTDNNGNKRQSVDINADNVLPVGKRDNDGGGGGFSQRSDVPSNTGDFQPAGTTSGYGGGAPGASDDIPF